MICSCSLIHDEITCRIADSSTVSGEILCTLIHITIGYICRNPHHWIYRKEDAESQKGWSAEPWIVNVLFFSSFWKNRKEERAPQTVYSIAVTLLLSVAAVKPQSCIYNAFIFLQPPRLLSLIERRPCERISVSPLVLEPLTFIR